MESPLIAERDESANSKERGRRVRKRRRVRVLKAQAGALDAERSGRGRHADSSLVLSDTNESRERPRAEGNTCISLTRSEWRERTSNHMIMQPMKMSDMHTWYI